VRAVGGLACRSLSLAEASALECSEERLIRCAKEPVTKEPDEWTEVVTLDCMCELAARTVGKV
jgi:hypothetical protein